MIQCIMASAYIIILLMCGSVFDKDIDLFFACTDRLYLCTKFLDQVPMPVKEKIAMCVDIVYGE